MVAQRQSNGVFTSHMIVFLQFLDFGRYNLTPSLRRMR